MSSRESFIRAIVENPNDDVPRLVFADWLDEHGDAARAEFIRAQIELSRLVQRAKNRTSLFAEPPERIINPDDDSRVTQLKLESNRLLHDNNAAWVRDWAAGLTGLLYWRGFVDRINTAAALFCANIFRWLKHEPITVVCLHSCSMMFRQLAECPGLLSVRTLELQCPHDEVEFAIERLADSRFCRNLEELILPFVELPSHSARLLMTSPSFGSLRIISPYTWDEHIRGRMNWWAERSFRSRFGPQGID